MPGLTRFPFQRSAVAIFNPSASTTFSAINPDQTVAFSTPVTRNFRPYRKTAVFFTTGLPAGLIVSTIAITGAALTGWTATYTIYNGTSNTITPATQPVVLYQED
jgi:hypothetical protein